MKKIEKVQKQIAKNAVKVVETPVVLDEYEKDLETNPKYSLEVDPENKYAMSEMQKDFIKQYVQFKNIAVVSELLNLDIATCKSYFVAYSSQQEIRRINKAMYQRQFHSKLLTMNDMMSYLSSLITDEDVAYVDRLKTMDKVEVIKLYINLQEMQAQALNNPSTMLQTDFENNIKKLNVSEIRQMLKIASKPDEDKLKQKQDLIDKINIDKQLLPEELAYLSTLTLYELQQLLDDTQIKRG